jgi:hypothetical protein
MENFPLLM